MLIDDYFLASFVVNICNSPSYIKGNGSRTVGTLWTTVLGWNPQGPESHLPKTPRNKHSAASTFCVKFALIVFILS